MMARRALRPAFRPCRAVAAGLLATVALSAGFASASDDPGVRIARTPTGVRYGLWGQAAGRPAPLVIVLAKTIEGTLGDAYFRQAGNSLAAPSSGGDPVLCASIDLPCHGMEHRDGEPRELAGWRHRLERGEDPMADNNRRLSELLDHLVGTGVADPRRIAVIGTSRGGFLAAHFLAHDSRVACGVAYCPVTDLAALTEFMGAEAVPAVRLAALHRIAAALAGRPLWMTIGGDDERVGTDRAIALAADITAAAAARDVPDRVELRVVAESPGHGTPAGAAERSAAWIRARFAETDAPLPGR